MNKKIKDIKELLNIVYRYPIELLQAYASDYKDAKAEYEFLCGICMLEIEGVCRKGQNKISGLKGLEGC